MPFQARPHTSANTDTAIVENNNTKELVNVNEYCIGVDVDGICPESGDEDESVGEREGWCVNNEHVDMMKLFHQICTYDPTYETDITTVPSCCAENVTPIITHLSSDCENIMNQLLTKTIGNRLCDIHEIMALHWLDTAKLHVESINK